MESRQSTLQSPGESLRSLSEVVTKSILLRVVTCYIVGHLYSLRRQEQRKQFQAALEIAAFLALPLLPLAQLCRRIAAMACVKWNEGENSGGVRYLSCAAMGVHTVLGETLDDDDARTMPLTEVRADRLTQHVMPYNLTWWGRLVVLLSVLAQATCTMLLWYNRHHHDALWQVDNRNVLVALGSLTAIATSAVIHVSNCKYTWDNPRLVDYDRYHERVSRYWAPQYHYDLERKFKWFWTFRTSLFWDVETALYITLLLRALFNHPYGQMKSKFGMAEVEVEFRPISLRLRPAFIIVDLVWISNCWLPLVHSLLYWARPEHKIFKILEAVLFPARLVWIFYQIVALVDLDLILVVLELIDLSWCPTACTAEEMVLFWKDPLENKLFLF